MSNRYIPRDQVPAASPWKMASLDPLRSKRKTGLVEDVEHPDSEVSRARDEGFRHGLKVGHAQGYAAGEAKMLRDTRQLEQAMAGLKAAMAALDEQVARDLVELALEVARQVVRTQVRTQPDAILPVVREALNDIISIAQHPRLRMHPDDAELVKREMAEELAMHNCRLAPDERIARGGVRIDDASFELDASLPTRWNRTLATLGLKDDWLA